MLQSITDTTNDAKEATNNLLDRLKEIADNTSAIAENVGGDVPGLETGSGSEYHRLGMVSDPEPLYRFSVPRGRVVFSFRTGEVRHVSNPNDNDIDNQTLHEIPTVEDFSHPNAAMGSEKLRSLFIQTDADTKLRIGNTEVSLRAGVPYSFRGVGYKKLTFETRYPVDINAIVGAHPKPATETGTEMTDFSRYGFQDKTSASWEPVYWVGEGIVSIAADKEWTAPINSPLEHGEIELPVANLERLTFKIDNTGDSAVDGDYRFMGANLEYSNLNWYEIPNSQVTVAVGGQKWVHLNTDQFRYIRVEQSTTDGTNNRIKTRFTMSGGQ